MFTGTDGSFLVQNKLLVASLLFMLMLSMSGMQRIVPGLKFRYSASTKEEIGYISFHNPSKNDLSRLSGIHF